MRYDEGKYGEYLIYKNLKEWEICGAKFLFNVYIPRGDGKTTELDVVMIHTKGVFVFESKNYSGWIFGDEKNPQWTQVLPAGKRGSHKERFYNPIMQNQTHIKWLRRLLTSSIAIRSIVVFSDHCTLKDVTQRSQDVRLVTLPYVTSTVASLCEEIPCEITENEIEQIYRRLYPYSQVNDSVKMQHVWDIHQYDKTPPESALLDLFHANCERMETASSQTESSRDLSDHVIGNYEEINEGSLKSEVQKDTTEIVNTPQIRTADAEIKEDLKKIIAETQALYEADKGSENRKSRNEQPKMDIAKESGSKTCPRCGSKLVIRIAKKGVNTGNRFYGCSNYPKCRYVLNMIQHNIDV